MLWNRENKLPHVWSLPPHKTALLSNILYYHVYQFPEAATEGVL